MRGQGRLRKASDHIHCFAHPRRWGGGVQLGEGVLVRRSGGVVAWRQGGDDPVHHRLGVLHGWGRLHNSLHQAVYLGDALDLVRVVPGNSDDPGLLGRVHREGGRFFGCGKMNNRWWLGMSQMVVRVVKKNIR